MKQIMGYTFKNEYYIETALTHSSYAHEMNMSSLNNNERQEFLGDAVLELVISNYIFNKYTDMPEGEMTKLRASIVCEDTLSKAATEIGLGQLIKLGKGEIYTGGRERPSILADAMEAVFGAVYLDGGFDAAEAFILDILKPHIELLKNNFRMRDCKTYLQELIQKTSKEPIVYNIIGESGLAHSKEFMSSVVHDGKILGKGRGKSKKEAEQNAAADAISRMKE